MVDSVTANGYAEDPSSPSTVSGQVTTTDGTPVSNATVKVLQPNYSTFRDLEGTEQEARDRAEELLTEVNNPTPPEFQNFSTWVQQGAGWTGTGSVLDQADGQYAVVHEKEDWGNEIAYIDSAYASSLATNLPDATLSDPQLGEPSMQVPAGEPVVVSAWDASDGGFLTYQDSVDSDLPGATTDSDVIVQPMGPGGSFLGGNYTVETEPMARTGASAISGKTHHGATVNLSPGVYRVQPESGGTPIFVIAGEQGARQIASGYYDGLRDRANQTSERAERIQQLIDEKKFTPETVATNETGHFSMEAGSGVERVGLIAYKKPAALDSVNVDDLRDVEVTRENVSRQDIRELYNASQYNGSFHVPTEMARHDVGNDSQGITVETREVSAPSYGSLPRVDEAWQWFNDYLNDHTYAEAMSALQQRLDGLDDEDLRENYLEMYNMAKENSELQDRANEKLPGDFELDEACLPENDSEVTKESLANCLESGEVSEDELRDRIGSMEETIQELENTIEAGDGASEIVNETLNADQQFDVGLDSDDVQVLVHFTNGTSKTIPTDSEYVSIEENLLGGSTINLDDYPVGESPAATAHFRVVTEEGMGESRNSARNPAFGGDIPSLDAVDLSSMNPGPDETVRVRAHPSDTAAFAGVEEVSVHGPDGQPVESQLADDGSAQFVTAGEGVHHVKLTYSNLDGQNFSTTFRVLAANEERDMPASVRVQQSPVGTYALTGDKLDGGAADVSDGGGTVNVAGRIDSDADSPGTVHVHTHGLSLAPDSRTEFAMLRGDDGKTVSKNVRVVMHTPELSDGALVWKRAAGDAAALATGESSPEGLVEKRSQNATISSYTGDNGRVTIRTIESPGRLDRVEHWVDLRLQSLPDFSLPTIGIGMMAPDPTMAAGPVAALSG